MNRYLTALCVVSLLFAAAATAPATTYPAYTCTELVGLTWDGTPNAYGGSLLTNGTVIGETVSGSGMGFPNYFVSSWNSSGTRFTISSGTTPLVDNVWGDDAGQIVINNGTDWVWNGSIYTAISSSNLPTSSANATYGVSDGGLLFGGNTPAAKSWAYDLNTSTYYSFGSGTTWANGANAAGYVVGTTGSGTGYVWHESNQSYSAISGLESANGVSPASAYVVGETTGGKAGLYSLAGSQLATYWSGEATFVNDSGLVVGDTAAPDYNTNYTGRAMAYFPNFNGGQSVDLTTAYAPGGVTLNFALGVNDAGQILVASGYAISNPENSRMFLLTPVPEPSALLLAGTGLLGLAAYAWRKRK